MNILEKIIENKTKSIRQSKEFVSIKRLEMSIFFDSEVVSMTRYLKRADRVGIISEIKRSSPSAGIIREEVDVEKLSISYMQSGASAISVLTEENFFSGSRKDLETVRRYNFCPILRKDFIIDEYQIIETKSWGADCVLLIAACLSPSKCKSLAKLAKDIGLEVLLEVHNEQEIASHVNAYVDLIGVNNRNLENFDIEIENSIRLSEFLPDGLVKISESGIRRAEDIRLLKENGYDGFLIGGHFMSKSEPAKACKELIEDYKSLANEN